MACSNRLACVLVAVSPLARVAEQFCAGRSPCGRPAATRRSHQRNEDDRRVTRERYIYRHIKKIAQKAISNVNYEYRAESLLEDDRRNLMPTVSSQPKLLSTKQAAELLNVSKRTILNWVESDKIPYVKLPGGDYRIPLAGLLASLSGTYRLDEEIRALDERYAALNDADVQMALEGDD
jgi:excisionase family DNA binding protein